MGEKVILIQGYDVVRDRMMYAWELVQKGLQSGPVVVRLGRPSKSRDQEAKYHAMIGDIAKTVSVDGRRVNRDVWKAYLVQGFEEELKTQGRTLARPSQIVFNPFTGQWVTVRASTKNFRVREAADFIEYLYAFGVDHGATFSERSLKIYQQYREAM